MERPWTARDVYQMRRTSAGVLHCRRLQSKTREVTPVPIGGAAAFDSGPQGQVGASVLALSVLADLLAASSREEDYRTLSGVEGLVWDLHRGFHARWVLPLRVEAGVWRELDVRALEAWVAEEARGLAHPE